MGTAFSFPTPIALKVEDPAFVSPEALADIAQAGEALGFDEITVFDHFLEPPTWQPSYFTSAYDPIPLLSFLAARTTTLRIGSWCINLPYRNPAVLANELASVDALSGGRLTVGVAAGYLAEEYATLGFDTASRGERADEYLAAVVELFTNEVASFSGKFVHFEEVRLASRPVQQPHPPLWSLGGNRRALRRAIRHCQGWNPIVALGRETDELFERLRQEHPGQHVPQSKTHGWLQAALADEKSALDTRARPLELALAVPVDEGSFDTLPQRIQSELDRGATRIDFTLHTRSLDAYFALQRRVGEEVLPQFRD
jgi:probable F420-dependent oxidoreductase